MNARDKKLLSIRPDEWGFYDPDEAGFAAVIKRLGTRVRATTRKPAVAAAKESAKPPVATTAPAAKEPAKTVVPATAPVRESTSRKRKA